MVTLRVHWELRTPHLLFYLISPTITWSRCSYPHCPWNDWSLERFKAVEFESKCLSPTLMTLISLLYRLCVSMWFFLPINPDWSSLRNRSHLGQDAEGISFLSLQETLMCPLQIYCRHFSGRGLPLFPWGPRVSRWEGDGCTESLFSVSTVKSEF